MGAMRKAAASVDPIVQVDELMLLDDVGKSERAFLSGVASALTAMGTMALGLSIVGIYALLSFMVTRRTREIGIRIALGAATRQVLAMVVGAALSYLALGGVIGTGLGLAFVELRSWILIRMPAPGVWMPLTIFLTLAVAGITACWLPARRALRIRPSEALATD
jgi:ABC-type antimicrobial peptide transport system permease subunit